MAYDIRKHLKYNAWANEKVADVLRAIEDEIFYQENKCSFPSIAKTVLHMWGAQHVWLRRMEGESPRTFFTNDFEGTRNEALDGFIQSSYAIADYVSSRDQSFLSTSFAYTNMKGDPFEDPYEDTLFHIVNHSTYHRGQIISMLREASVAHLPGTDLIHYLRTLPK